MKHQALFPYKDKSKKIKCHLLQFLFGALRVKKKKLFIFHKKKKTTKKKKPAISQHIVTEK